MNFRIDGLYDYYQKSVSCKALNGKNVARLHFKLQIIQNFA